MYQEACETPFLLLSQPAQKGAVPMRGCVLNNMPGIPHCTMWLQARLLCCELIYPTAPDSHRHQTAHHQAQTLMFLLHSLTPQDRTTTTQLATLEWGLVLVTSLSHPQLAIMSYQFQLFIIN